jgi:NAD(P)-dependent dehydrogenase (short-subunit alcohol dehydrogenase family)
MIATQKVAVISDASQGIGAALVTAYRKHGYAVVAHSRSITASADPEVLTVPGDLAQPGVGAHVVEQALAQFGRIDTLINNARVFTAEPFTDDSDADYDHVTGVDLRGFFDISHGAVAAMLSRDGGGHVVNVSTRLVDYADAQVPSALAEPTKGGLSAVTKSLATEYAGLEIRVNSVALGVIRTPMHAAETHDAIDALHRLGQMSEIDDVVDAILYLEEKRFCLTSTLRYAVSVGR